MWKSIDFGATWNDISNNIPTGPVNVIREDPKNANILYVGTDFGAYVSVNGGVTWQSLSGNFPTTYVQDLVVHPRDQIMVAATHGRGIWAIDISYIQQLATSTSKGNQVFDIPDAKLPTGPGRWYRNTGLDAGFAYYLTSDVALTLEILDANGNSVTSIKGSSNKGLNFANWNLSVKNKLVEPGTYTLNIKGNSVALKKTFEVKPFKKE